MTKPVIVTRAGKGLALTYTEQDANFTNLQNATLSFTDGTNTRAFNLNDTITLGGFTVNSSTGVITANISNMVTTDTTQTITGTKTFTGNVNLPRFTCTQTTGTSPFIVSSTTVVDNLNAALLNGYSWASPPTIGGTTANSATFTNLTTTGTSTFNGIITGTGLSSYITSTLSSPGTIGNSTPNTGRFTSLRFNSLIETGGSTVSISGTNPYTYAPDASLGTVQYITSLGSISSFTFNGFTNPVSGQSLTVILTNNGMVLSITSSMKFAGGIKDLSGVNGAIDIITVYYDGTNYFASINRGFA